MERALLGFAFVAAPLIVLVALVAAAAVEPIASIAASNDSRERESS